MAGGNPKVDLLRKMLDFNIVPPSLITKSFLEDASYGEVCSGEMHNEPVAVKRVGRQDLLNDLADKRFTDACLKRCNEIRQLSWNASIVEFKGAFKEPETCTPVFVFELMKGTLEAHLNANKGQLGHIKSCQIVLSLCQGFSFLLDSNEPVKHLLRSRHVLMNERGEVKIDFLRLSHLFHTSDKLKEGHVGLSSRLTRPSLTSVTPKERNENVETFLLGVLLLEICTQEPLSGALSSVDSLNDQCKEALASLDDSHPLKPIICWSLLSVGCRPSLTAVCYQVTQVCELAFEKKQLATLREQMALVQAENEQLKIELYSLKSGSSCVAEEVQSEPVKLHTSAQEQSTSGSDVATELSVDDIDLRLKDDEVPVKSQPTSKSVSGQHATSTGCDRAPLPLPQDSVSTTPSLTATVIANSSAVMAYTGCMNQEMLSSTAARNPVGKDSFDIDKTTQDSSCDQPFWQSPISSGQKLSNSSHPTPTPSEMVVDTQPKSSVQPSSQPHLSVGSVVIIKLSKKNAGGTIRWIGTLPDTSEPSAGVELDCQQRRCGDGFYKGVSYFHCPMGHSKFVLLDKLTADPRFIEQPQGINPVESKLQGRRTSISEPVPSPRSEDLSRFKGEHRGIQGHHNSCYLDSTLFAMYAFTPAFDALIREVPGDPVPAAIVHIMASDIVYPLRQNGAITFDPVMKLRFELDKLNQLKGLTHAEQDPEEFLNLLFKHVLKLQPFLKLARPSGLDTEFFLQIFVEKSEQTLFTMKELLFKSMKESKITFQEAPQRLILQLPRYGKQYKIYDRVYPELHLNVSDLCADYTAPTVPCVSCGCQAEFYCHPSTKPASSEDNQSLSPVHYACGTCAKDAPKLESTPTHSHHWEKMLSDDCSPQVSNLRSSLELVSVICIDSSHYVSFCRHGDRWFFFDSMTSRTDDGYNIPSVQECTFVGESLQDVEALRKMDATKLPPLLRRLVNDASICIYVDLERR